MHPLSFENVDGTGKRGRCRWHKNRVLPVPELLNDECRDEGFFDLDQRRYSDIFLVFPHYPLGQAPE